MCITYLYTRQVRKCFSWEFGNATLSPSWFRAALPLFNLRCLLLLQFQRRRINAIQQAAWLRPIFEDTARVPPAPPGPPLRARHPVASARVRLHGFFVRGSVKTGPAGT